jgi:peptidoglycan/LPS O-acetylase OafA/YrhL
VHLKLVLQHVLMIGSYDEGEYNTAFWSLVVEMRVSIVFPLMFWGVYRMRTWAALGATLLGTVAMTLIIARHQNHVLALNTLLFGLIFVCGIVLAKHVERVNAWYRALRPGARVLFAVASFLLYTWGFRLAQVEHRDFGQEQVLITLGAAGYMILALNAGWAKQALATPVARFLGRISYSLYLVHGTVLFALTHALGDRVPMMVQLVLYLGISIGLGYLFCAGVEEQFLRLSRMVGRPRLVVPQPFGAS